VAGLAAEERDQDFHYYGGHLPKEEFAAMLTEFESELARTKTAHIERFGELSSEDSEAAA
jgi:hypothetical protein